MRKLSESSNDYTLAIRQPASFQKAGYYPTRQHLYFDAGDMQYNVAPEGLLYANAGH